MAAQFRQQYGKQTNDDNSFATPEFTQKRMEIHPNQSYEVSIEGESVIVLGSSLKPMRSKKGYYRLLYQEKLYVIHSSEIREVDRTENDVISGLDKTLAGPGGGVRDDTDEETTEIPTQNSSQFLAQKPAFMQSYNVKLSNTWLTLPSSAVRPSREMPGFYNVTYQGQIYNVTAVNVVPVNNAQPGYQQNQGHSQATTLNVPNRYQRPTYTPQQVIPSTGYQQYQQYPDMTYRSSATKPAPAMPTADRNASTKPDFGTKNSRIQPQQPPYQSFRTNNSMSQITPGIIPQPQNAPMTQSQQQSHSNFTNMAPQRAEFVSKPMPSTTQSIPARPTLPTAPAVVPTIEKVTEDISNMAVNQRRIRAIRRDSYTVKKPFESGKVRVLVGGNWKTIDKKSLKPSKKKPETFIARIDGKSVRLKQSQIAEYKGEDEKGINAENKPYQVFLDGKYVTVPAGSIEDAPKKIGFKIVTFNGITQLVHTNFIFPMRQTDSGLEPIIPDFYKVYLTPGGVTVPKENIKPDETLHNTFMVLWNNIIYKLSAENLTPILPTKDESLLKDKPEEEKSNNLENKEVPRKRTLMDHTISTTARKKSPVKPTKKPLKKPSVSKLTANKTVQRAIPERPKGVFPAKESGDEMDKAEKKIPRTEESAAVVNESKTSLGPEDSNRDNCSRSPYESPISWDKRLRKLTGHKKKEQNIRPRWKVSTANKSYNNKSKKLLYKKLMVPSKKVEGRYQLYGSAVDVLEPNQEKISLATFIDQQNSNTPSEIKSTIGGRTSVAASESIAIESTVASSVVDTERSKTSFTEKPYISTHGDPKALLATTPGIPVLQDHRILAGPDARANRDWVRSLRAV